jgi:hypothetical protein
LDGGAASEGDAVDVIDELGLDVLVGTEDAETGLFGGASDFLTDA